MPAAYLPRLVSKKLRVRDPFPPWQQVAIVAWSGMRGVISLAAAFALPFALSNGSVFPGRNYIVFLAFSVILATLALQGLTLPFLIRKLGIKPTIWRTRRSESRAWKQTKLQLNSSKSCALKANFR